LVLLLLCRLHGLEYAFFAGHSQRNLNICSGQTLQKSWFQLKNCREADAPARVMPPAGFPAAMGYWLDSGRGAAW
jgi:hypothetical protein